MLEKLILLIKIWENWKIEWIYKFIKELKKLWIRFLKKVVLKNWTQVKLFFTGNWEKLFFNLKAVDDNSLNKKYKRKDIYGNKIKINFHKVATTNF